MTSILQLILRVISWIVSFIPLSVQLHVNWRLKADDQLAVDLAWHEKQQTVKNFKCVVVVVVSLHTICSNIDDLHACVCVSCVRAGTILQNSAARSIACTSESAKRRICSQRNVTLSRPPPPTPPLAAAAATLLLLLLLSSTTTPPLLLRCC